MLGFVIAVGVITLSTYLYSRYDSYIRLQEGYWCINSVACKFWELFNNVQDINLIVLVNVRYIPTNLLKFFNATSLFLFSFLPNYITPYFNQSNTVYGKIGDLPSNSKYLSIMHGNNIVMNTPQQFIVILIVLFIFGLVSIVYVAKKSNKIFSQIYKYFTYNGVIRLYMEVSLALLLCACIHIKHVIA